VVSAPLPLPAYVSEAAPRIETGSRPDRSGQDRAELSHATPSRAAPVAERAAPVPSSPEDSDVPRPDRLQQEAERYFRAGRLGTSESELMALSHPRGQTEKTLFGFSVRELCNPDAGSRIRAAERLKALGDKAAAPALATALHAERDPKVLVPLLHAFASLASGEGAEIVIPLLTGRDPEVRIAALKALLALDPKRAAPQLAAASRDPDPWVRRRASLLALGRPGDEALRLSEEAAHDGDPDVRRLSTLALGAAGQDKAKAQLLEALSDTAGPVRAAAASSLGRMLGKDVGYVLSMDPVQRRREIRKLAVLPLAPVRRTAVSAHAPVPMASTSVASVPMATGLLACGSGLQTAMIPNTVACGSGLPTATATSLATAPSARTATVTLTIAPVVAPAATVPAAMPVAPAAAAPVAQATPAAAMPVPAPEPTSPSASSAPELHADEALGRSVMMELRSAIRGRTLSDLSGVGLGEAGAVEAALDLLIARGQVVRRGSKFFVA
jgi:hypothetical protein